METAAPMGGLGAEVVRSAKEDLMLILLLACAEFAGTDYRGGWREVECDPAMGEGKTPVEALGGEPRPFQAYASDGERWYAVGALWSPDGATLNGGPAEWTECRIWLAE